MRWLRFLTAISHSVARSQLDAMMAEAPKELVSCSSVEVVSEGGTIDGSADLCLHPVEVRFVHFLFFAGAAGLGLLLGSSV